MIIMFIYYLRNIFSVLEKKHKIAACFLLFLFLTTMLFEAFSITLFIPISSLILNDNITDNNFINVIFEKFNLSKDFFLFDVKNFLIFLFIFFLIRFLLINLTSWLKLYYSFSINTFLINKLFKKYLSLSYKDFIKKNSSKYLEYLNFDVGIFFSGFLQLLELFLETLVLTGIIIILLIYNFKITLYSIIFLASLSIIFTLITKKKVITLGNEVRILEQQRYKNYIESFSLIKEIKIFNIKNFFIHKDFKFTSNFYFKDILSKFIRQLPRPFLEFLTLSTFIIFIFIFLNNLEVKKIIELIAVFGFATLRILPSINRILNSIQIIKYSLPASNNIISECNSIVSGSGNDKRLLNLTRIENSIKLKNINIEFDSSKKIFNDLNFEFKINKLYGIKGRSGVGKSSLINIICGLSNPDKGEILYDNKDISKINLVSLYNLIGYVPQNTSLLDDTIKNNILFGYSDFSDSEILEVCEKAEIKDLINNSSQKLETIIGEKNNKISGGEAQRIGIARALLRKPNILILDESFNALDDQVTDKILKNLISKKHNKIILIVTHEKKVLDYCDEIIDLNESRK